MTRQGKAKTGMKFFFAMMIQTLFLLLQSNPTWPRKPKRLQVITAKHTVARIKAVARYVAIKYLVIL